LLVGESCSTRHLESSWAGCSGRGAPSGYLMDWTSPRTGRFTRPNTGNRWTGRNYGRMTIHRRLARQLVPGLVLPGAIYLVVSRHTPLLVALAAASSIPLIDAVARLARRKPVSPVGLVFLAMTGLSVGLALWL